MSSRRAVVSGLQRAAVAARGAAPAHLQVAQLAPAGARTFRSSPSLAAKEMIGPGLESDPMRGVRIKKSVYDSLAGTPRSWEYDNVLEQDPMWDVKGSGGNDDIFGEWGLNRDAPHIPTSHCVMMLTMALTGVYCVFRLAKAYPYQQVAAPREGLWNQ
eukprot:CAMPEP_0180138124 /NCGR_PEP_ID=MMETSP0986-20121125/12674_1 /TAXON_ID=697907 /ORGANISM="non described non described, Strain CCMP2293" /LENGTH=157 /DNA_ID=CAMNT_0022079823 /DNA_START=47 /DNA_END=520 /DNA_ORIENTATION=-